jgi:hypothetical protein
MSDYNRMARIESAIGESGVFRMTLATEGEASDGHILSIKGGQIPEQLPLLTSHWNDPSAQLGSITEPRKALKDSPPRLRAMGQIEMGGEEPQAAIRRDLAHMIARGHLSGVSVRWDEVPGKTIRRVNLPSDHPYYVEQDAVGPERYGLYFEEWRALEGSVVAVPADQQAMVERAEETEGEVRAFWRAMAEAVELDPPDESPQPAEPEEINLTAEPEEINLTEEIEELRIQLAALEDRFPALEDRAEKEDSPASPEPERVQADPLPAIASPKEFVAEIRQLLSEADARQEAFMRDQIDRARGKVK